MRLARGALVSAALAGAAAVLLGAFGAHALRTSLDEPSLAIWRTAVDYQFWHALALLGVACLARDHASTSLRAAALAFVLGIVLFCGSLYALALGASRVLGAATPIGGLSLIAGWISLAVCAWHDRRS